MKISVYIRNRDDGAAYYRIYQYVKLLQNNGHTIKVREFTSSSLQKLIRKCDGNKLLYTFLSIINFLLGTLRRILQLTIDRCFFKPNVLFIQREIFPRKILKLGVFTIEKVLRSKVNVIWDFDDNIYINGEISKEEINLYEKFSSYIIVPTEYLKQQIPLEYQNKVQFLPTTDTDIANLTIKSILKERKKTYSHEFRILWLGTYGNLKFLNNIINELDTAADKIFKKTGKKVVLEIVCNKPYYADTFSLVIENTIWSRHEAIVALKRCHIGIMPLVENDFTLGKAGFKAVQYLGAALPAIISEVGFNKIVIEDDISGYFANGKQDWITSVERLGTDEGKYLQMSVLARKRWEESFHSNRVLSNINSYINQEQFKTKD